MTSVMGNGVLATALETAVPLHIDRVRDLPYPERQRIAMEAGGIISGQGDTLMFGGRYKFGHGAKETAAHQVAGKCPGARGSTARAPPTSTRETGRSGRQPAPGAPTRNAGARSAAKRPGRRGKCSITSPEASLSSPASRAASPSPASTGAFTPIPAALLAPSSPRAARARPWRGGKTGATGPSTESVPARDEPGHPHP